MTQPTIPNRRRWFEIIAVTITGIGKFIFMDWLDWRFAYIASACIFWLIYALARYRQDQTLALYWGFRTGNFWKTFKMVLPFGLLSLTGFYIAGYLLGTNILSWHILPLLLLYPLWGVIQHFLMIALVAGNLKDMEGMEIPQSVIVFLTALLFSMVHLPFHLLVAGTFVLAIFYTIIYLKEKNLYVLGLFHGWIGAFFFYTLMERDPYIEVFGKLGL